MKESSQNCGLPAGAAAREVFMRMQPPDLASLTLLLCTNLPLIIVVRHGQQMGVWMKKFETLAPAPIMCCIVKGIACIDPSRKSWSSVSSIIMFFCDPILALGSGPGPGSLGGASSANAPPAASRSTSVGVRGMRRSMSCAPRYGPSSPAPSPAAAMAAAARSWTAR